MADLTKALKQIKIDSSTTLDIVPEKLQNSGYTASLPTLTADSTLALTSDIPAQLIEKTYSQLKTLRDNSQLVPGTWYRITDYACTTTTTNTSSAGHAFDVIVLATAVNKLSEEARAIQHSGDTYFANNNLSAWKIWYCLDNDTNRFAWADSTNGKGVICRMIDEFNNDCPYDFKNILFTKSGKYTNAYTFTYTESGTIKDASLLGLNKGCYDNVMKEWINSNKQKQLNFNVFYTVQSSFECFNNTFGVECHDNTFGNMCYSNAFGDTCFSNTFGDICFSNTFDKCCTNNIFESMSMYNTFGIDCQYITLGMSSSMSQWNIIDDGCKYLDITSETSFSNLQNVHVHLGIKGSSSNHKTITIPDGNLSYETNVYPVGSTDMFA